ncbi:hypothetical protein NEDG_00740 [Nematocida displodere]|uniref:Uncharacterized protein n=1 Tax=Nematocida displodere TaxID=1805483 RepID=A0A177ECE3_9MICR|nr:hypothetical protein NEDG_00740 [Nematocida displodere]
MDTNADKALGERNPATALGEKDHAVDKVSLAEALNIMHGWRFVPDTINLKKRMLYALTVSFDSLSIWVYKQIVPFIDAYGVAEFEAAILPRLLKEKNNLKYATFEIRQELEQSAIVVTRRIYGEHASTFFTKTPAPQSVQALRSAAIVPAEKEVGTLYVLLQLILAEIDEADARIIEVLVFFGYILDQRLFDFLISYFHQEKDFLLELLLIKMRFAKTGLPENKFLSEAQINGLFKDTERKEYGKEGAEALSKEILLELSEDKDVASVNFAITRCCAYIDCRPDPEVVGIIVKRATDRNKAVRMQAAAVFPLVAGHPGVSERLLQLLEDADDEVKYQARKSIGLAIPRAKGMAAELIARFVSWKSQRKTEELRHLPEALIAAKKLNHPSTDALYDEYCAALLTGSHPKHIVAALLAPAEKVFALFIRQEQVIEEELRTMHIDGKDSEKSQGLSFPSPKITSECVEEKYFETEALSNLEGVVTRLADTLGTAEMCFALLPKVTDIMKGASIEQVVESFFLKDPNRNWRYWTGLFALVGSTRQHLGDKSRARIVGLLAPLKDHWAKAVRVEARACEAALLVGSIEAVPGRSMDHGL